MSEGWTDGGAARAVTGPIKVPISEVIRLINGSLTAVTGQVL